MPATSIDLNACEITRARVTGDHQVAIRFRDGLLAELNLADWLSRQTGSMVEPLHAAAFFADMDIDDGVLTWPNGYDLDPVTVRHWAEQGHCD